MSSEIELLAAAVTVIRHSNALILAATHGDMTDADLSRLAEEVADHEAGLSAALNVLTDTDYDERVDRINALADRLIANAALITEGRPSLLKVIIDSDADIRRLRIANTTRMSPASITTKDNQFSSLANRTDRDSQRSHEEDVLLFEQAATLSSDLALNQTLLAVVSRLNDPTHLARIQEIFDSAANRIERAVEYLDAYGGSELVPGFLPLAEQQLAAGKGPDNYFDLLQRRLDLVVAERDLIDENTEIRNELLFEIESLTAEIEGKPVPEMTISAVDETDESGITDETVLFGQSAAFSGPTQALGEDMRRGIEAAFQEVNESGGVHGRSVQLTTLDDTYESDFAFANTLRLIEDEKVFALIGAVGTPTSRAASPLAHAAGVPFIAPFTGAELLRDSEMANTLNVRASYYQETETMIERLTEDLDITRVAVLYQNDSYRLNGLEGVRRALERRGLEPVASWYYQRNTTAVKSAVFRIAAADPEAVIIIGSYAPAAESVKLLQDSLESDPVFMTVSFVGSEALADELGDTGTSFYVTQVVPLPDDTSLPVVAALQAFDPDAEPGFVSLEGYLAGRLAIAGLELCGPDLSRECFLEAVYDSQTIDIDGLQLEFTTGDNQGSDDVVLTVIGPDGNYHRVDSLNQTP
ncbi:MAG: ABC transporter substrate-binding protein [Acidimicrobiaceae bacterium]|nr:ABC transporter substrate-binding protein [Acidimicrobiaceae bacterium]